MKVASGADIFYHFVVRQIELGWQVSCISLGMWVGTLFGGSHGRYTCRPNVMYLSETGFPVLRFRIYLTQPPQKNNKKRHTSHVFWFLETFLWFHSWETNVAEWNWFRAEFKNNFLWQIGPHEEKKTTSTWKVGKVKNKNPTKIADFLYS